MQRRFPSIALAVIALAVVALMVMSVPSGAAIGVSSASSTGNYTGAYDVGQPTPYLADNVTLSNISLAQSNPALTYSVISGGATNWVSASGVTLNGRVPNPVTAWGPASLVVPGVLQHDTFGAKAVGYPTTGNSASYNEWWNSPEWSDITLAHTAGATITNSTSLYGQPDLVVALNASRNLAVQEVAAGFPAAALPSLATTNDYLTVIYSVTSSTNDGPAVAANGIANAGVSVGILNNSNEGTVIPWTPSVNKTTEQILPYYASGDAAPGETGNYAPVASFAGVNKTVYESFPISDAALNVTSSSSPCGPGTTVKNCAKDVYVTVLANLPEAYPYANITVTILGVGLTTAPVSVGESYLQGGYQGNLYLGGHWVNTFIWENTTSNFPVVGSWGAPSNLTGWSPTWGTSGWDTGQSFSEAWAYPAANLGNVTTTLLSSASGGGVAEYSFPFSLPSAPALVYQANGANVFDTTADVQGVNYTAVTGCQTETQCAATPPNGQTEATKLNALKPGHNVLLPTGSTSLPAGTDPYHTVTNESLSYNATTWCVPDPTGTGCAPAVTAPVGLSSSVSVTGLWILLAAIVVGVLLVVVFFGGEKEEGRKMRGGRRGRRGTLNGPSLRRSRLGMAGVRHAKYESRTKEAYEHDSAGAGWFLISAILAMGAFWWLTTSGILGFVLTQLVAAAVVIVLLVLMVVLIVVWESTKTVSG